MILLCQGAGGLWTGLGWATPKLVGRLLLGHTVRQDWWVGSTGHYEDSTGLRPRQPVGWVRPRLSRCQLVWGRCL